MIEAIILATMLTATCDSDTCSQESQWAQVELKEGLVMIEGMVCCDIWYRLALFEHFDTSRFESYLGGTFFVPRWRKHQILPHVFLEISRPGKYDFNIAGVETIRARGHGTVILKFLNEKEINR